MSEKSKRIDLGLAVMAVLAERGKAHSCAEIAAWCDCTPGAVSLVERRAMKKLRRICKQEGLSRNGV